MASSVRRRVLSAAFLTIVVASSCYGRKASINDFTEQKIPKLQRLIYDTQDFFGQESLGLTDLSPETEKCARECQKQMNMEDTAIRFRSMSTIALKLLGEKNAKSRVFPFANTILIDEEWFKSLPEKEQKALIGHELAHIKNKYYYKSWGIFSGLNAILNAASSEMLPDSNEYYLKIISPALAYAATKMYDRSCEFEADKISALELNNIDGNVDLLKRLKDSKDPHSRFILKRALRQIGKFVTYPIRKLYASSPKLSRRIERLEELKTE